MLLAELPGGGVLGACRSASEVVSKPWASGQRYSMKDDGWATPSSQHPALRSCQSNWVGEPLRHKPGKTDLNSQTRIPRTAPGLSFTIPSSRFASGSPLQLATGTRSHLHPGAAQRTIAKLAIAPSSMQMQKGSCPHEKEVRRRHSPQQPYRHHRHDAGEAFARIAPMLPKAAVS